MSSLQKKSHPLPPLPPGHLQQQYQLPEQRPDQRQRSKSSFSLRSDKSHKSSGSIGKLDLHETSKEKSSRRLSLTTKADPRLAMQEAEPAAVQSGQASLLAPLRAIQHLDAYGNPIADPDRSNPTRSRWERPLDTIRSFEAAIDGSYSRKPYMRTESAESRRGYNRRSSYVGGSPNSGPTGPRYSQESYNPGRHNGFRPDSYAENRGMSNSILKPNSYYDNNTRPSNGYYPSRARYPRTPLEPPFNNSTGIYPVHGIQQSYETVTSATESGTSGDPLGYSTDPSSDNSSLDRIQPPSVPEHNFANGLINYGSTPSNQVANYASYGGSSAKQVDMQVVTGGFQGPTGGPPPPPQKESAQEPPRVPTNLGSSRSGAPTTYNAPRPAVSEKRKSWFARRFSKGQ